uniref:Uncharacterized protein n=1 Tax=viral metagenome TaxID=1070528 RepID=A0A6M3X5A8_9ZZZZ
MENERQCKLCKKQFSLKTEWQKFCSKQCHDKYWRGIYAEKGEINRRLEELEKKVGI